MRTRATVSTRKTRPAHSHCEWWNDRHRGYCAEPASATFRHPRGLLGILFTCSTHALDALADGKRLSVGGYAVGGPWL
jgi:hypothetical protein